jgi:hypothetical protein
VLNTKASNTQEILARVGRKLGSTKAPNVENSQPLASDMMDMDAGPSGPSPSAPALKPSSYLVGHFLDEYELAGEEPEIFWPFRDGIISDWVQAEALWYVIMCSQFIRC